MYGTLESLFEEQVWEIEWWGNEGDKIARALNIDDNLKGVRSFLDYGCGAGAFSRIVAKKFPEIKILAVDMDKRNIYFAKDICNNPKNIEFVCEERINGTFDSVGLMRILHDQKQPNTFLKDIKIHLGNRGILLIADYKKISFEDFLKVESIQRFPDYIKKGIYDEHCCGFSTDDVRQIAETLGFETMTSTDCGELMLAYVGRLKD